ncbi:hypothetical protein EDB80DRAFT_688925 [Ilyonectria destructans]|nr:hypothetical protein EDB80DRAFT_688925 [Ilyonectria destructans]
MPVGLLPEWFRRYQISLDVEMLAMQRGQGRRGEGVVSGSLCHRIELKERKSHQGLTGVQGVKGSPKWEFCSWCWKYPQFSLQPVSAPTSRTRHACFQETTVANACAGRNGGSLRRVWDSAGLNATHTTRPVAWAPILQRPVLPRRTPSPPFAARCSAVAWAVCSLNMLPIIAQDPFLLVWEAVRLHASTYGSDRRVQISGNARTSMYEAATSNGI